MQERYRTDYDGEFVILSTSFRNGKKEQQREWVPNAIQNQHTSGRAAVIANGKSRSKFPIKKLENHRGGLLGSKRLQTYGCLNSWKELQLNFYVELDGRNLPDLIETKYQESTIVYTTAKNCIYNPGEFYIIPYGVTLHPIALSMYLAAFDGHKEVFCLGVDGILDNNEVDLSFVIHVEKVIKTYQNTRFTFVNNEGQIPEIWKKCFNCSCINYPTFISYCDV